MEKVKVKCHKCEHIIEVTSKKRPLKVKCPECKAVGILREPLPKPEPKPEPKKEIRKEEAKPKLEKEVKEAEPPLAPSKPTPVSIRSKLKNFLKQRIIKPIVILLVVAIILTSVQLASLIPTGETRIVPNDFGIPQELELAKQEFESSSGLVKERAENLVNELDWGYEKKSPKEISYNVGRISKPKPEWSRIFEDIENANITPETTYKPWTHTTTADFRNNCSFSENVDIANDMIRLHTLAAQGVFISTPLDSGTDNAVLKNVVWHPTTQPHLSEIVIIVGVSYNLTLGIWVPVWSSRDVIPEAVKQLFPDFEEIVKEVVSGRYFMYAVVFLGGVDDKPLLEDITINVATATIDRRYYVFTYYNDILQVDRDGVAGGAIPQLGFTLHENNSIDVDGDGDDDFVVSLVLTGIVNEPFRDWWEPPTHLIGGLNINIYRARELDNLTIYFVKPVSYENKTYIWIIGFYFYSLPGTFSFTAISENITLEAVAFAMGGQTIINVTPPYQITWNMDIQISELSIFIGYAQFQPVKALNSFEARFSPGIKYGNIYYEEVAERTALTWSGSEETNISACYKDENLYGEFELSNLPSNLNLSIINLSAEIGRPFSVLEYNASGTVSKFSSIYYDFSAGQIAKLELLNLPIKLVLRGTFTIPPKEELNPDASDTFIGRALNYVIARISAAMNRVRKALRSISETFYAPDNVFHLQSPIAKLEFAFLKGSVENNTVNAEQLLLSGNYIGSLNTSIQAGLTNVTELKLSLGRNITLLLKRSAGDEAFKAICIYKGIEILVDISKLPSELAIEGSVKGLSYIFKEPVELAIIAKTQNYNLEGYVKNAQEGNFTRENQNVSFEFGSEVELHCALSKGHFYKMTDNYLFVNTFESAIALRLEKLKFLRAGEIFELELFKEYPLKVLLNANYAGGKILVKNLATKINISLARPLVAIPELEELNFSKLEVLSSFANALEQATHTFGKLFEELILSESLTFSYTSAQAPIIIANLSADENTLPWTHGIALSATKSSLHSKMYLELPQNGTFSLNRSNGLELRYLFENWVSSFNWLTASLERDNTKLFAHLLNITELKNGSGVIKIVEEEVVKDGVEVTLTETLEQLNLSIEILIANVPQNLSLTFTRRPNLTMVWEASSSTPAIYLNIAGGKGTRKSYFLAHKLPEKFEFKILPSPKLVGETFAIHKALPEFNISASEKFDFQLKLAGELVGREGEYKLYVEGLKYYSVRSESDTVLMTGDVDKLLFEAGNATVGLARVEKLELLAVELTSVRFAVHSLFGKMPVLELSCNVKELQINLKILVSTPVGKLDKLALTNFGGFSLSTRRNSIRITDTATHYIFIAPILSLLLF
ncbi:MAG: hypothetical protein QMD21_00320 [Candidatus Thermoplasmatota archaeon]|nr:hypothetical protein [Candidatus Thermoplasmatota archaeon]